MGYENYEEYKITCKEENDTFEIIAQRSSDSDDVKFYSIEYVLDYVIPERVCDTNINVKKISILELSHCNITSLPLVCKNLNLKHLGLSHNKLTEAPLCLYSGLKYLESLDLSYNNIERFDIEPECIFHVKLIKLNNNHFENIPKWFLMFKCINLEEFNYSHNKAKHYKYSKDSTNMDIMKLQKLELKNNSLIDGDYSFLKCFKFLKYLDISNDGRKFCNNFIELDDLFVKPRWKELSVLMLNNISLSIFPEGIAWIYTLKELYVTHNSLSWIPNSVEFLVNLEILDISNNSIVSVPHGILSLTKLATFQASDNCIQGVPDMSQLPNLKSLDLYNNYLDAIEFSVSELDLVDLEYNYYDTKNLDQYSLYQEKKSTLRRKYKTERYDGPKEYFQPQERPPAPGSESDEDYRNDAEYISTCPANIDEQEDWDISDKVKNENPDIDSVDDEWHGEENKCSSKTIKSNDKIYISDDDWMFTDYEES